MASIRYKDVEISLVQDEDVLDTWFSSGLWPFATVGWPDESALSDPASDYNRFYPSSVMETGHDILFFWVARMVMMGMELTDKPPFHTIYLHGLVRSDDGQKMSKSKGNVIDPLDTIDLYGTDALRFSLVTNTLDAGQDIPLSVERIEENRNFVNKLWNIGKYVSYSISTLTNIEKQELNSNNIITKEEIQSFPLAERHIISSLHVLINKVTDNLELYNFSEAGRLINDFLWYEFADWYVEISKTRMKDSHNAAISRKVLIYTWDTVLRLLHPIMPYITEILYQNIPRSHDSIMVATWPLMKDNNAMYSDVNAISSFNSLQELVRSIRNVRAEYNVQLIYIIYIYAFILIIYLSNYIY
jgi:valyl-tRNA synthetase